MTGPRSAVEWETFYVNHMPPGEALDLEEGSDLRRILAAKAQRLAEIDAEIERLSAELRPSTTSELLPDFERLYAFPRCDDDLPETPAQRRAQITEVDLRQRNLTPAMMIESAARRGFEITIREYFPDVDPGDLPLTNRHRYDVTIVSGATQFVTFRAGQSRSGDALGKNTVADLQCLLDEIEPAWAQLGAIL